MGIITLLGGLFGGLVIGSIVAVVVVTALRREAMVDREEAARGRDEAIEAARQAFAVEREVSTQKTVDLVLSMAADKLGDQSVAASRQLDLRNQLIEDKVTGMTGELARVTDLVATLQKDRAAQQGDLTARLAEATQQSRELAATTQSLQHALASPKARGQWGERMADDVLRMAGLVEGVNYHRQTGVSGGGIPDVTFLLPQGRVLHMDVKFPIDNYIRAIEATSEADVRSCTTAFLRDVRQRIKELTTRAYIDPATTVDYVLAFIPNESVYSFIHEHDPDMVDVALGQRVVLCSPFTLFAVLAIIRQSMDAYRLERTSDEILTCLGGFTKEWEKFSDQVDKLGRQFDSTQRAYDDLSGTRRRALQRRLDQIEDLRTRRGDDVDGVVRSLRVAERGQPQDQLDLDPVAKSS